MDQDSPALQLPTLTPDQVEAIEARLGSDPAAAVAQLRQQLSRNPLDAQAYRLLARALDQVAQERTAGTVSGYVSATAAQIARASEALRANDLETAEIVLRRVLAEQPRDIVALRLMAEIGRRLGLPGEAEQLLRLGIEFAPEIPGARIALAAYYLSENRLDRAVGVVDEVLASDPRNADAMNVKAGALGRAGRTAEAAKTYEALLKLRPEQAQTWSRYGQMLRSEGQRDEAIKALRKAVELAPFSGALWWGLSDVKTYRFTADEAARMEEALAATDPSAPDRYYLHFALAKAHEDAGDREKAFTHFAQGNRLQQSATPHRPEQISGYVKAAQASFSADFFRERESWGRSDAGPIFVIGMPRAGSTLVEQILGSHSQIEATQELPEFLQIGQSLAPDARDLPAVVAGLTAEQVEALGSTYLQRTRMYRQTSKPLFVDKMPNNWLYLPLIHLALPNAKFLDVRRHPLDCGWSNFKQLFLNGQGFSTDLTWMGRYYADYVAFMRHVDEVLPGRVHRIIYEQLVDDVEAEVRRLLEHVGVPFEANCLRHNEQAGAIRSTSSDQVRQPVNRAGIGTWRPYEAWLDPLVRALGPVLDHYPEPPPPA